MSREQASPAGLLRRHPVVACAAVVLGLLLIGSIALLARVGKPQVAQAEDRTAAQAGSADEQALQRLWYAVVELRNNCAVGGASGWNSLLTPQARTRLDQLSRQIWGGDADWGWSYFFSRTLFEIGRPTSDAPLVGFYHPWSDVWLITQWQLRPEVKITGVEMLCGDWVRRRGEPPFDLRPDWLRRDGFRVEQLARATADNIRQFERLAADKRPWREALRLDEQKQLLEEINGPAAADGLLDACLRADELALGAEAFDKNQPPPAVLKRLVESCERFLDAARQGNASFFVDLAADTSPATAEIVRRLAPDALATLVPVYWLADEQWAQAYLVPDHNPDFCLALTYKRVEGRLQLTRIDLLHFPIAVQALAKEGSK